MKNKKTLPSQNKKKNTLRLDPALRAALIWLLPSLFLRITTTAIGYSWVGVLLQLVIYIVCGYMAASAYYESIRRNYPKGRPTESVRSGAKSGITLGILLSVLLILSMFIFVWLIPAGFLGIAGEITLVWLIPVDVLSGLFLGALGGKLSAVNRR